MKIFVFVLLLLVVFSQPPVLSANERICEIGKNYSFEELDRKIKEAGYRHSRTQRHYKEGTSSNIFVRRSDDEYVIILSNVIKIEEVICAFSSASSGKIPDKPNVLKPT